MQLQLKVEHLQMKNILFIKPWKISLPIEADWTATAGLLDGQRSGADPSFAALGLMHRGMGPGRAST